jgi:hypothetical protein
LRAHLSPQLASTDAEGYKPGAAARPALRGGTDVSDVFISYARSDRPVAMRLAAALQALGLQVWWDRELAPGQRFAQVIAEELASTRCVVVLWSRAAMASNWVSDEAADGQRRGLLVPAVIETGLQPPLGFRGHHTADIGDWVRGQPCPEFERLCEAVARMAHGESPPSPAPPAPPPGPAPSPTPPPEKPAAQPVWQRPWFIGSALVLVLVAAAQESGWLATREEPPHRPDGVQPVPAALSVRVQWRDEVLGYSGQVTWDGASPVARIVAGIVDLPSGQGLGEQGVTAQVQRPQPGQVLLQAQVSVPWDSNTRGPHEHEMNLLFQQMPGGGWQFIRNCRNGPQGQPMCW